MKGVFVCLPKFLSCPLQNLEYSHAQGQMSESAGLLSISTAVSISNSLIIQVFPSLQKSRTFPH